MPVIRQVRSLSLNYPEGGSIARHRHNWDQLVYAENGALELEADDGTWINPPKRALWIPAGTSHSLQIRAGAGLRTLYFPATSIEALPRNCSVFQVTQLVHELVTHCIEIGILSAEFSVQRNLIAFLVDQIGTLERAPFHLPHPTDQRAITVARLLHQSMESEPRTPLDELCRRAGASRRTIERLFRAEVGMTLGEWRILLRMVTAAAHLADGLSVTQVGLDVGYESTSAFIATFVRTFGQTPKRFAASSRGFP